MYRLKIIITSVVIALLWGSLTGLFESVGLLYFGTNPFLGRILIVDGIAVYSVVWGIVGLVTGIIAALTTKRPWLHKDLFFFLFFLFFSLYFELGYYINHIYLPEFFSLVSILFESGLALLVMISFTVIYRKMAASRSRGDTGFFLERKRHLLLTCWVILIVAGSLLGIWPKSTYQLPDDLNISSDHIEDANYNVLIILIDTLRKDHMSLYKYERETTPNIDRVFSDGVWFTNAFAQSSHTKPSTASLLTSLYVSSHNMSQLTAGLPEDAVTASELFKLLGYRTAMFSVNPLVSPFFGFEQGVDYFFVHRDREISATALYSSFVRLIISPLKLGRKLANKTLTLIKSIDIRSLYSQASSVKVTDASATQELLEWIEENKSETFFAYIHYLAPHHPYDPPPPFDQLYVPFPEAECKTQPRLSGFLPFYEGDPMEKKVLANMIGQYDGEINYIDDQIRVIIEKIQEWELDNNTLVIITSDHGEEFYDHRGWTHGLSLFNEVINVPLIMWQPSLIKRQKEITMRVQQIDLLPTILDLLGFSIPDELQGKSFARILTDPSTDLEELPIVTEIDMGGHGARSIIKGKYKYIYSYYGLEKAPMLFDIEADMKETAELIRDKSEIVASLAESLSADLHTIREITSETKLQAESLEFSDEVEEKLRALGYIE